MTCEQEPAEPGIGHGVADEPLDAARFADQMEYRRSPFGRAFAKPSRRGIGRRETERQRYRSGSPSVVLHLDDGDARVVVFRESERSSTMRAPWGVSPCREPLDMQEVTRKDPLEHSSLIASCKSASQSPSIPSLGSGEHRSAEETGAGGALKREPVEQRASPAKRVGRSATAGNAVRPNSSTRRTP